MTVAAEPASLWQVISAARRYLADAGIEEPLREARLFAQHALAVDRWRLTADRDKPMAQAARAAFERAVARRAAGEPAARILGAKEFWSLDFALSPDTLVPRPDSEAIVEAALAHMPDRDAAYRIVDLGTGTGCLLLALVSERPAAWGLGLDRAPGAVVQARANALALGLADRTVWAVGDWGAALAGPFDLIVCNPPYIAAAEWAGLPMEVRAHDPRLALDGGRDGLDAYRALLADMPRLLTPSGHAVIEIGYRQAPAVSDLATRAGLATVDQLNDLAGRPRGLVVRPA